MGRFRRVTPREPCPVCGREKWCYVGEKGVFCTRVPSAWPTRDGTAWFHPRVLEGPKAVRYDPEPAPRAEPEKLDRAYRALLEALTLSERHLSELVRRGLDGEWIEARGYRTLPEGDRRRIAAEVKRLADLRGVPGFWRKDGLWHVAGPAGILLPVRDLGGRIVGFQVKKDDPDGGKYCWLSSRSRGGASPGTPVHVIRRPGVETVLVVEGVLKAEVVAYFLRRVSVVGVPGVSVWRPALPVIHGLGKRKVLIAYDADLWENEAVRRERDRLARALGLNGYRVALMVWDERLGKGLDDVLRAGKAAGVRVVRPKAA